MVFDVMNLEEIAALGGGHGPDANWNGTSDGEMLFLKQKEGEDPPPERSVAKISSPYYRDAGAGCVFAFSYYADVRDYRSLSVTLRMANASDEQKIDHVPEPINNTVSAATWPRKSIGIGRREGHFAVRAPSFLVACSSFLKPGSFRALL